MQPQMVVVGKPYTGKDKDRDFKWMVKQKQYDDTLFVMYADGYVSLRGLKAH